MYSLKRFKKMSIKKAVIFSLMLLFLLPQTTFGKESEEQRIITPGEEVEEHSLNGEFIPFTGTYSKPEMSIQNSVVVDVVSGPTKEAHKFVRYLTDSWAKASSYTWSKSNAVSSSVSSTVGISASGISSSLGISNTVTTTYTTAISVPADSSRYSKLAYYSDFNRRYLKIRTFNYQGVLYKTEYTYHYQPLSNTYLSVAYQ